MADGGLTTALLVGQAGMTVASIKQAKQGAKLDIESLRLRQDAERLASAENTSLQADQLLSTLSYQQAAAATRGIATNSGSVMAQQNKALSDFQADEGNNKLNLSYKNIALQGEIVGTRAKYRATKMAGVSKLLNSASTQASTYGGGGKTSGLFDSFNINKG